MVQVQPTAREFHTAPFPQVQGHIGATKRGRATSGVTRVASAVRTARCRNREIRRTAREAGVAARARQRRVGPAHDLTCGRGWAPLSGIESGRHSRARVIFFLVVMLSGKSSRTTSHNEASPALT